MSTLLPVNYESNILFYTIGDVFQTSWDTIAVLAQVSASSVCLIVLETDCNRWADPVKVEDVYKITEEELNKITKEKELRRIGRLV